MSENKQMNLLSKNNGITYSKLDFTREDFSNKEFVNCTFEDCILDNVDFRNSNLHNVKAEHCSFKGANFKDADLSSGNFRYADLSGANLSGTNCYYTLFEYTKLEDVIYDENTRFYKLRCPEIGGFVAYKKCVDGRIVTLYIPKDAKRTSATGITCRASKAKVLMIESFDGDERYEEAYSLVAEDFSYQVGEVVVAENFNEDRWMDSTTGIHFFMTKDEAKGY